MQFDPRELIRILNRISIQLPDKGEYLMAAPGSRFTEEMKQVLRKKRVAILEALKNG